MPKYYVLSEQLKFIVDCNDEVSAIMSAIHHAKEHGINLGSKICVSEQGFADRKQCYDTDKYTRKNIE